ncbi:Putative cysteine-rich repeat secretory protein 10, partial [Frankliniella fusca]
NVFFLIFINLVCVVLPYTFRENVKILTLKTLILLRMYLYLHRLVDIKEKRKINNKFTISILDKTKKRLTLLMLKARVDGQQGSFWSVLSPRTFLMSRNDKPTTEKNLSIIAPDGKP